MSRRTANGHKQSLQVQARISAFHPKRTLSRSPGWVRRTAESLNANLGYEDCTQAYERGFLYTRGKVKPVPRERMKKHIIKERGDLMDQAQKFAKGGAQRIERREGEMTDVSEERLNIILGQVHDIDSIINDSGGPASH